ncbi:MAG: hypothetical protein JXA81_16280 [Sedimentisphaerales bacterium]|nr:hypothetical protein [Sedimentisphaerales bacterium]
MNHIRIDIDRVLSDINRNIFGGFIEHVRRVVYGGVYDSDSPLADKDGLRSDLFEALKRLNIPIMRYPGGNFVSGYRWMDGVGPREQRPTRHDLAWNTFETNEYGTNEFIGLCRKLNMEPYLCVNCGDGDMREAVDWVEYCNSTGDSAPAQLRRKHGFEQPHRVKYWGVGNEVDGQWQIGYKSPEEYARALTEFSKVMKRVDRSIEIVASAVSVWPESPQLAVHHDWKCEIFERGQLMLEQAGNLIDHMAIHWYARNPENDFAKYMTTAEQLSEQLSAYEGLIRAVSLEQGIQHRIGIAIDEWHPWRHVGPDSWTRDQPPNWVYNLEDALVTAMYFNAYIRHAGSVRLATMIGPVDEAIRTSLPDRIFLQTDFYPYELYSCTCGNQALDVFWDGDTFSGGDYTGVRNLDVAATLDEAKKQIVIYVVNRSRNDAMETEISLAEGQFEGTVKASVINGADIKTENSYDNPDRVVTRKSNIDASGKTLSYSFEPHSVTALECDIR